MQDDCANFARRLREDNEIEDGMGEGGEREEVDLKCVECPFEVHAHAIVEETFGIKGAEGGSRKIIKCLAEGMWYLMEGNIVRGTLVMCCQRGRRRLAKERRAGREIH